VLNNKSGSEENIYLARVKQFNEFVDRFNYKTDFRGEPVDSLFKVRISREKMLNYLFDLDDKRIFQGNDSFSQDFIKRKSQFISETTSKNLTIYKYSENIVAEAKSRIIFNGKPCIISIFLNQEIVGNDKVKWIILDVKGDMFDFVKRDTTTIRFIPPGSNETDFMNLKRALRDEGYLHYYASENFKFDRLSAFIFGIQTGIIKFDYVEEITYHIFDIPGWCLLVKEFNRHEMNSGWLITDLTTNDQGLKEYLEQH